MVSTERDDEKGGKEDWSGPRKLTNELGDQEEFVGREEVIVDGSIVRNRHKRIEVVGRLRSQRMRVRGDEEGTRVTSIGST